MNCPMKSLRSKLPIQFRSFTRSCVGALPWRARSRVVDFAKATLAIIFFFLLVAAYIPHAHAETDSADPLPSWNDGPNKQAILDFIQSTTTADSLDFVKPADRIAVFDQDGTLWVEKPIYTEAMFSIDRLRKMAHEGNYPHLKDPFTTMLSGKIVDIEGLALENVQALIDKFSADKQDKSVSQAHSPQTPKNGAYEAIIPCSKRL